MFEERNSDILNQVEFKPAMRSCGRNLAFSIGLCAACLVVTLVLLIAATPRAQAAETVILKKDSYVSDSVITVGDIFENAGLHANHVLAPAPAAGETMVLGVPDLLRIAKAFDFNWIPQSGMDKIVLQRAVTEVEKSDIARVVETAVLNEIGAQQLAEVSIESIVPRIVMNGTEKPVVVVETLDYRPATGRFEITLGLEGANGAHERLDLDGHVYNLTEIPVLAAAMKNGDVIRKQDLAFQTIREDMINQSIALSADDLVGMTPRRTLPSDRPVRMADLERPRIVKKGEIVTMTLRNGPMLVTAKGKALDHGAKGDIIRILNVSSNRVIDAEVTGPQRAEIELKAHRI